MTRTHSQGFSDLGLGLYDSGNVDGERLEMLAQAHVHEVGG